MLSPCVFVSIIIPSFLCSAASQVFFRALRRLFNILIEKKQVLTNRANKKEVSRQLTTAGFHQTGKCAWQSSLVSVFQFFFLEHLMLFFINELFWSIPQPESNITLICFKEAFKNSEDAIL